MLDISNNILVYTVCTNNNYDHVYSVPNFESVDGLKLKFVFVSDSYIEVPEGWELLVIPNKMKLTNLEYNRFYKINPDLIFYNYKYSIYIDGNIKIVGDLTDTVLKFVGSGSRVSAFTHPVRSSVYEEAECIKELGYGIYFKVNQQMRKYKNLKFKSTELFEANVLFRSNDYKTNLAMKLWWKEFRNGIKRDQLSFTYACERVGIKIQSLGSHDARGDNMYFKYCGHLKSSPSRNLLYKLINRVAEKIGFDEKVI